MSAFGRKNVDVNVRTAGRTCGKCARIYLLAPHRIDIMEARVARRGVRGEYGAFSSDLIDVLAGNVLDGTRRTEKHHLLYLRLFVSQCGGKRRMARSGGGICRRIRDANELCPT